MIKSLESANTALQGHDNNCSRGSFTRDAIMEKLERDGFLSDEM